MTDETNTDAAPTLPPTVNLAWANAVLAQVTDQRNAHANELAKALARINGYIAEAANYQKQIRDLNGEVGRLTQELATAKEPAANVAPKA